MDHQRLDDAFEALSAAVTAHDALQTARPTAAFKFHFDTHLAKEDAHLFRIIGERVPVEDQVTMVRSVSSQMPSSRIPEFTAWIYPLLGDDDRENFTRALAMLTVRHERMFASPPDVRMNLGCFRVKSAIRECCQSRHFVTRFLISGTDTRRSARSHRSRCRPGVDWPSRSEQSRGAVTYSALACAARACALVSDARNVASTVVVFAATSALVCCRAVSTRAPSVRRRRSRFERAASIVEPSAAVSSPASQPRCCEGDLTGSCPFDRSTVATLTA
jgi:hypothetical protein